MVSNQSAVTPVARSIEAMFGLQGKGVLHRHLGDGAMDVRSTHCGSLQTPIEMNAAQ